LQKAQLFLFSWWLQ